MKTYDELRRQVEVSGGLLLTTMERLRDIQGSAKLGVHVRKSIHDALSANGLGHLPDTLPAYQEEQVRIFRQGTPIADTINAVLHPSDGGDQVLRQSAGSEAQDVLKQIRELVCE